MIKKEWKDFNSLFSIEDLNKFGDFLKEKGWQPIQYDLFNPLTKEIEVYLNKSLTLENIGLMVNSMLVPHIPVPNLKITYIPVLVTVFTGTTNGEDNRELKIYIRVYEDSYEAKIEDENIFKEYLVRED